MKKVLVIIDVQKGFISEHTKGLATRIKKFVEKNHKKYSLILFTQHINNNKSYLYRNLGWKGFMKEEEYGLMDEIAELAKSKKVFIKDTYGAFVNKKIESLLKNKGIKEVHLAGIDTENCVLTFARDAFDRGFNVVVFKNLCRSHSNPSLHKAALEIIKDNIGEVR
ncbi:cysteine hydrolase [Patescibacteria group bacterium]|nr:cysteine hydrolase [Patescibacteria group bacterium]